MLDLLGHQKWSRGEPRSRERSLAPDHTALKINCIKSPHAKKKLARERADQHIWRLELAVYIYIVDRSSSSSCRVLLALHSAAELLQAHTVAYSSIRSSNKLNFAAHTYMYASCTYASIHPLVVW